MEDQQVQVPFPVPAGGFVMNSSEKVGTLFAALAKAQAKFDEINRNKTAKVRGTNRKDGTAVEYSYRYADLGATLAAILPALNSEGIALIQPVRVTSKGVVVTTILMHGESEQWVSEEYEIPAYSSPQDQGSAITYARRYSVWCLTGVAPEDDDDGKGAQDARPLPEPAERRVGGSRKGAPELPAEETLTKDEQKAVREALLAAARKAAGADATADELASKAKELLRAAAGVEATKDIPRSKLQQVTQFVAGVMEPPADPKPTEPEAPREPGGDDE
jgi:hypothetical protein